MNGAMNSVFVVLCLCSGIIAVSGEVCQVERVSGAFEHKEYNGNYIRQDISSAEEDVSSDKIYHVYIYQKNKMMFCAEGKWYIGPIPNDPDSAVLKSRETYSNWPHTVHEWFEQSSLDIWRINPDITVDCTTAGGGLSTAWIVLITMAVILVVILSLFGLIYVCKPPGRPTTGGRNTVPAADNRNDTAQASFGMERPRTPPPPYSGITETRSNIPLTSLQAATVQNVDLSHNNYKTGPPSNAVEVRDPCTGTEGAACPSISAKPTAPNKDSSMSQTYNAKLGTGQHATSEHGDN